ncbi:TetR/AcrR family transcriptional regulator [Lacrimispora celerecrescens]|uniref:TetR/AcrR family transcriptional regulator n=1 Tax=Lacrimispora celerecrescens TaxID=29354 RepID=UPI001649493C|nr:TetR/AcrR family transcriptional regulator [Lacrimispora celerecrescens]
MRKQSEIRKQELVEIALDQFLANGYEQTTIRSILKIAGGEVGMFYHYFKSKEEIFDCAINLFLDNYVKKIEKIADTSKPIMDVIMDLIKQLHISLYEYSQIKPEKFHWSMDIALHQSTLRRLVPIIEGIIHKAKEAGIITVPLFDNEYELTVFLLFGISGILHDKPISIMSDIELKQKERTINRLVSSIFGIPLQNSAG